MASTVHGHRVRWNRTAAAPTKRPPFWRALLFCVTTTSVGMDTRSRVGMGNRRNRIRMGNRNRSRNNRVDSDDDSNGDGGNNRCSELS